MFNIYMNYSLHTKQAILPLLTMKRGLCLIKFVNGRDECLFIYFYAVLSKLQSMNVLCRTTLCSVKIYAHKLYGFPST